MNEHSIAVSVVIPTRNRPALLERSIAAIDAADAPRGGFEVLVVDNSDPEHLLANRPQVARSSSARVHHIEVGQIGLMAARNVGVMAAVGEIVCFLDDDSFVHRHWLTGVERAFAAHKEVGLVAGPNAPTYEVEPPGWLDFMWNECEWGRYLGYLSLLEFGSETVVVPSSFVWGCNLSIRRDTYFAAGGSNPDIMPGSLARYAGDGETALAVRVDALGLKAIYVPTCAIDHFVASERMTPEYFRSRAFYHGYHNAFTETRRAHGLGARNGVSPLANRGPTWLARTAGDRLARGVELFRTRGRSAEPEEVRHVRGLIEMGYREGRGALAENIEHEPHLLEWVLRPDYLGDNANPPGHGERPPD